MNTSKKHLIVIVGPTAIGKTAFSIKLAQLFNTEIISADSRQFFKEMSIGTAKPNPEELSQAPHHFIGTISINDFYSAGKFEKNALAVIEEKFKTHEVLILVGGSGLYINAVCNGIDDIPSDENIKNKLLEQQKKDGLEPLLNQLKQLDESYYNEVDKNNPSRIIRALEVCLASGKPYSSFRESVKKERPFNIIKIGLDGARDNIYNNINQRVDNMMREGLLEEAKALYPFKHLNALQTVGYSELFDYFDEKISLEEAIQLIKQNTRRYAKRQLTWFKKDEDVKWFDFNNVALAESYALSCLHS
ncbi:MAG: tRNA (adenosine(37)-N6)-dimethylallyltransferase MiaA [Bacteroidia bacterium]